MTAVVDIYIKLILAVLGFVAPTVTLLFPVFFKGIAIIKERLVIQESQFETLIQKELETIDNSLSSIETLGVDAKKIKSDFKKKRKSKQHQATYILSRSLHYFELKKQIQWIFIPLFLSLVYVMIYSIVKENIFNMWELDGVKSVGKWFIEIHSFLLILTCLWLIVRIKVPNFNKNLSEWHIANNKKWLYLALFITLLSVLAFFCIKDNWFNVVDDYIKIHIEIYILSISLLLFLFTVRRLWGIVCTVIEAKPMLEEQDKKSSTSTDVPSKPK